MVCVCWAVIGTKTKVDARLTHTRKSHKRLVENRTLILMPLPTLSAKLRERSSMCTCRVGWGCGIRLVGLGNDGRRVFV